MDVTQKTIGMLIDELSIANIRCFVAQDILMGSGTDEEKLKAAITAQEQNAKRNSLIRAIDQKLGDANASPSAKTYA